MSVTLYQVGGCVRDELLGVKSKDIDFAVEAESFAAMREWLFDKGFRIFKEAPKYFTIRAHFPREGWGAERFDGLTADFVLCRKERDYVDGRRPETVEVGTIYDDLARRDFTVNAMAKTMHGELIDPFNGQTDLNLKNLKCVGSAEDRIREDALRGLRAIRFEITKGLMFNDDINVVLQSDWFAQALSSVSVERQREEMLKCFHQDTLTTIELLSDYPKVMQVLFKQNNMWLKPTMEA